MLGFSEETQGCLPCKITTLMDDKWQIEWWDDSQADKIKDKTELQQNEWEMSVWRGQRENARYKEYSKKGRPT
jgi:hypothetical protein